jgi:hypothetical protein
MFLGKSKRLTGPETELRLYHHVHRGALLRGFAGDCTIKLAYQAAEANHPV